MKEENFNKETLNELIKYEPKSNDAVVKKVFSLDEFRQKLEKLMFEEFHARFKGIKELYDINAYITSINEVIALGKRLEDYLNELNKIVTEIMSLIDDDMKKS